MRQNLLWDSPTHHPKERYTDVPGVGRYLVRRSAPKARTWVVKLNNQVHSGLWNSAVDAMNAVEREVATMSATARRAREAAERVREDAKVDPEMLRKPTTI